MEHLPNDHENHPNHHEDYDKPCDEMRHPVLSLLEIAGETIVEKILVLEDRNLKEQDFESHSQGSK